MGHILLNRCTIWLGMWSKTSKNILTLRQKIPQIQSINFFEANTAPVPSILLCLSSRLLVPLGHPMPLKVTWSCYTSSMFALIRVGLRDLGWTPTTADSFPAQTHRGMLFMFSTPPPIFFFTSVYLLLCSFFLTVSLYLKYTCFTYAEVCLFSPTSFFLQKTHNVFPNDRMWIDLLYIPLDRIDFLKIEITLSLFIRKVLLSFKFNDSHLLSFSPSLLSTHLKTYPALFLLLFLQMMHWT